MNLSITSGTPTFTESHCRKCKYHDTANMAQFFCTNYCIIPDNCSPPIPNAFKYTLQQKIIINKTKKKNYGALLHISVAHNYVPFINHVATLFNQPIITQVIFLWILMYNGEYFREVLHLLIEKVINQLISKSLFQVLISLFMEFS